MEYLENPFTPSFGEVPAHLAGRQLIIRDLDRAFLSQRRRPELTSSSSSIPGSAVVFTAIQPWDSTLVASDDMRAVLPVPRAPEKIEVNSGRLRWLKKARSNHFEVTGLGIAPLGSIEVNRVHDASTWRYRASRNRAA